MGKKCQKGQFGFTKGCKNNHSYHSLYIRSSLAAKNSAVPAAAVGGSDRAAKANSHPPIVGDEYIPTLSDSLRRSAILYHYLHVLECPDRDEWYGPDGTII